MVKKDFLTMAYEGDIILDDISLYRIGLELEELGYQIETIDMEEIYNG